MKLTTNVVVLALAPSLPNILGLDEVKNILHRSYILQTFPIDNDCSVSDNKRTCSLCQQQDNKEICAYSTCPLGSTKESIISDCSCRIQIGSYTCGSCTFCESEEGISVGYECDDYGKSECCNEKNGLRACTQCYEFEEVDQKLCVTKSCPLDSENTSLTCTCNIKIGNKVCNSCQYCDNSLTTFGFDCGAEYGSRECP